MTRQLPDLDELTQAANIPASGRIKPAVSAHTPTPPAPPAGSRRRGRPRKSQAPMSEADTGGTVPLTFRLSPELHFWLIQQAATTSLTERRHVTPQEIAYDILEAAWQQGQRKTRTRV